MASSPSPSIEAPELNLARRKRLDAFFAQGNAQFHRILFSLFEKRILDAASAGKRATTIVFASTQRLEEWLLHGDCSAPVALVHTDVQALPADVKLKQTVKMVVDTPESVLLILATSLLVAVDTWTYTAFRMTPMPDAMHAQLQNENPTHFHLKAADNAK